MADQVDKFIFQTVNADKIRDLTRDLEQQEAAVESLVLQLKQGAMSYAAFEAAARGPATRAVDLKNQINDIKASTRDMNRFALEASHAWQDFAQGGVGGALNNIPRLVEFIGGPMGLGAAISALSVGAYVATPVIKTLWKELTDGGEAIPETVDSLGRLNDALKVSKGRLEEIKTGWGGSAEEVATYNEQLAETARLEKAVSDEKERQSGLEKARKEEAAALDPVSSEGAAAAKAAMDQAGGADATVNMVRNALDAQDKEQEKLRAQLADLAKRAAQRRQDDPWNLTGQGFFESDIRLAQGQLDAATQRTANQAADIVNGARAGRRGARDQLASILPGQGFGNITDFAIQNQQEIADTVKRDRDKQEADAKAAEDARKANPDDQRQFEAGAYKHVLEQRRVEEAAGKVVGDLADGLERVSEMIDKELERGAQDLKGNDYSGLVRDVESQQFGGLGLSGKQVDQIAEEVRKATAAGVDPMYAAAGAIQHLLDANAALMQRYGELNTQFNSFASQARQQADAVKTPMRRIWGGASGDAADPEAVINDLAARMKALEARNAELESFVGRGRQVSHSRLDIGRQGMAPGEAAVTGAEFNSFAANVRENVDLIHERVGRLMREAPTSPSLLQWGTGW